MGASMTSSSAKAANGQFVTLAPRIKNISESTIRKRWKPLPASSQEKIRQILFDIKTKRAGGGGSGRIPNVVKKAHAGHRPASRAQVQEEEYEKAVEEVAERLLSRLPHMPFPPTSGAKSAVDDSPFDLSATLHRIANLQAQLTMNTQSANLLRMQIKREKKALQKDRAELDGLKSALKSSQTLRRRREKGLHPLARAEAVKDEQRDEKVQEEIERVNAVTGISGYGSALAPADRLIHGSSASVPTTMNLSLDSQAGADPELESLLEQLRSHLVSMQNNTASLGPVMAAMDEAKTTLDRFAVGRFDDRGLRRVCGL